MWKRIFRVYANSVDLDKYVSIDTFTVYNDYWIELTPKTQIRPSECTGWARPSWPHNFIIVVLFNDDIRQNYKILLYIAVMMIKILSVPGDCVQEM